MRPDESDHIRKLASQIVTELDKDRVLELLLELNELVERIKQQPKPHAG